MALYERACNLCSGPFLVEDTYADWSSTRREQLKQIYFSMCRALAGYYLEIRHYEDAVKWTGAILREDRCDEAAHRQLIRIYVVLLPSRASP
jgi:DNA-binding SARP family transcriptional activator